MRHLGPENTILLRTHNTGCFRYSNMFQYANLTYRTAVPPQDSLTIQIFIPPHAQAACTATRCLSAAAFGSTELSGSDGPDPLTAKAMLPSATRCCIQVWKPRCRSCAQPHHGLTAFSVVHMSALCVTVEVLSVAASAHTWLGRTSCSSHAVTTGSAKSPTCMQACGGSSASFDTAAACVIMHAAAQTVCSIPRGYLLRAAAAARAKETQHWVQEAPCCHGNRASEALYAIDAAGGASLQPLQPARTAGKAVAMQKAFCVDDSPADRNCTCPLPLMTACQLPTAATPQKPCIRQ